MCFSLIFVLKWVLATGCNIKARGKDFFGILIENAPKLGPQWQGAEIPQTCLFLIRLLVSPIPHLVFLIPHLFLPNGAKMDPTMIPGDPIIRVFKSKTPTQTCATINTAFTLHDCFLLAVCLLPSCFLACFLLPCCLLPCCLLPCLPAGLLLACFR